VVTDVSRYDDVENLKDATIEAYQRVHVLCNNAGIGAGAEGPVWQHELNDWRWAFNVNVWGIIHGINAFVPVMLAQQEEGHVVNTSSGNGGITPITSTPQYAVTKSAVVTLTECLYGQLQDAGAAINASVLFPGPHMLRTGLWESYRNRPSDLPKTKPRKTPYLKLSDWEKQMADAGLEIQYTPVEEVADRVVTAIRQKDFWILPPDERTDEQIRNRAESMLKRDNPAYLRRGAT
jgi:NAD(P)-dependent dehydrogenase (short-subunit alcohol dehydrogenase family)